MDGVGGLDGLAVEIYRRRSGRVYRCVWATAITHGSGRVINADLGNMQLRRALERGLRHCCCEGIYGGRFPL